MQAKNSDGRNIPSEGDYIRYAVDAMRRTSQIGVGNSLESHTTAVGSSYKMAYYRHAIKNLYKSIKVHFDNANEIFDLIFNCAQDISNKSCQLVTKGLGTERVRRAIDAFAMELLDRLNNPNEFNQYETLAIVHHKLMRIAKFISGIDDSDDRRIAEAISSFVLMRMGKHLPEYLDVSSLNKAFKEIPLPDIAIALLVDIEQKIEDLREDPRFQLCIDATKNQFRTDKKIAPHDPAQAGAWLVKDSTALDAESTTYNLNNVIYDKPNIDSLRRATGNRPETLVVFKPIRMALHETIACAVTRIQMENPTDFLANVILGSDGIYHTIIKNRVIDEIDEIFNKDCIIISEYVNDVMQDHFHFVNPNLEIRNELDAAKKRLIDRIVSNQFDPRVVESRNVLRMLVTGEIIRKKYLALIGKIVDDEIANLLNGRHDLKLPVKKESERVAWITVGGPASGKSTLEKLILAEYRELHGSTTPLCQINSDHYKPLLLDKSSGDAHHGARTYWESGIVRQRAIDRLERLISEGLAPDFWVSTMHPSKERMQIAGHGHTKVNIYVITCPVEGRTGAVDRAYQRAARQGHIDFQRYMSTFDILENHRRASDELPAAIKEKRRDLRIYDNSGQKLELVASMDAHNRELRIFCAKSFLNFVKKSLINPYAEDDAQVYFDVTSQDISFELCKYLAADASLNFRYSDKAPNTTIQRIQTLELGDQDEHLHGVLPLSQPESYAWIGHKRAIIRDYKAFMLACGNELGEALLIGFGKLYPLNIRDYEGRLLLDLDIALKKAYVDTSPLGVDSKLRQVLASVHYNLTS